MLLPNAISVEIIIPENTSFAVQLRTYLAQEQRRVSWTWTVTCLMFVYTVSNTGSPLKDLMDERPFNQASDHLAREEYVVANQLNTVRAAKGCLDADSVMVVLASVSML